MREDLKRLVVRLQNSDVPLDDPMLDWAVNEMFKVYCDEHGIVGNIDLDKIGTELGFEFLFYLVEELDALEKERAKQGAAEKQKIFA